MNCKVAQENSWQTRDSTSHSGQQTQTAGSHGSDTGQTSGSSELSVWSSPWSCDLTVTVSCPSECIVMEQKTGCMTCMKGCSPAVVSHKPGGPSPTDAPTSSPVQSRTTHAPSTECPLFPPNCPQSFIKIENSCLVCTILQQATAHPDVSDKPVVMTTTTAAPTTCAPVRCIAPCNVGIVIMSNGCLACKCPDHV
ncbi:hypothetical protein CHS0354_042278 [Potamilus streckersoni]|uniref:Uncharacterized protein n=1 Tax=Potamilus streckersoni TaxID=2493646 RepID=A0AAE0SUD1_9BIVA|nr:hypothetical protein CHS0354_042278 [Potamilus streckersoni]